MIGYEIESATGDALVRLVRTLGQHRYVASRLHLVHVFAIDAAAHATPDVASTPLGEAAAWASRLLDAGVIDLDSKDERLHRKATDAELGFVLDAFWSPLPENAARRNAARARLFEHLAAIGISVEAALVPFDEAREEDTYPLLVDAGWELVPIPSLDRERHKGAIACFDDFEVVRFEEESAVPPSVALHELPALGAVELLAAFDDDGELRAPFVVWSEGNETYVDYVLRGALKAAKLAPSE